jgi:hypothetical protein
MYGKIEKIPFITKPKKCQQRGKKEENFELENRVKNIVLKIKRKQTQT